MAREVWCWYCGAGINPRKPFYCDTDGNGQMPFTIIELDDGTVLLFCDDECLQDHKSYWQLVFASFSERSDCKLNVFGKLHVKAGE